MNKDFEVVEIAGKGKVVVASRDFLPGTAVIFQEKPVMFISEEYVARYRVLDVEDQLCLVFAGRSIYNKVLSAADKGRFDALFGPTTGPHADNFRSIAAVLSNVAEDGTDAPFTAEEKEVFVRVANTIGFNAFGANGGGYVVMDSITRMSHSCLPNCRVDIEATGGTCRTILPVKKGEELTLEYVGEHRLKPTHFRRHRYLEKKEFTCHCIRCSAEADDTREFDCFDPQCPGSCFACQPLNKEPFILKNLPPYTGVEYVEPHLLPCTVCHRAPPLKFQQDMFALEKGLEKECQELEQVCTYVRKHQDISSIGEALQRIEALTLPRHHSFTVALLQLRFNFGNLVGLFPQGSSTPVSGAQPPAVEIYARDLVRAIERHCKFPNGPDALNIADTAFATEHSPTYSRAFALECLQKALRAFLVLYGRDCAGREKYNDKALEMMQVLPPQPATTTECMFCGESPLRAAFTLMKCGRCKQVTYCSAGCQKAHWPLHKKCCKQVQKKA